MMKKTLLLLFVISSLGCKSVPKEIQTKYPSNSDFISISRALLMGDGEEGIEQSTLVIQSEKDWNDLVTKMNSVNKVSESFSELPVQFPHETVIVVFDKVRSSGGFKLEVVKLDYQDKITTVQYKIVKPKPGSKVTTVMTQPYHIVKMKQRKGTFIFKETND